MHVKATTIFVQRIIQLKVGCMLEMAQLPGVPTPNSLWWKDLEWSQNQEADDRILLKAEASPGHWRATGRACLSALDELEFG